MIQLIHANVIGISEPKLDNKFLNSETEINNHDLVRCVGNKNGGGISGDLSYLILFFIKELILYTAQSHYLILSLYLLGLSTDSLNNPIS